jgi:hypothetical protein
LLSWETFQGLLETGDPSATALFNSIRGLNRAKAKDLTKRAIGPSGEDEHADAASEGGSEEDVDSEEEKAGTSRTEKQKMKRRLTAAQKTARSKLCRVTKIAAELTGGPVAMLALGVDCNSNAAFELFCTEVVSNLVLDEQDIVGLIKRLAGKAKEEKLNLFHLLKLILIDSLGRDRPKFKPEPGTPNCMLAIDSCDGLATTAVGRKAVNHMAAAVVCSTYGTPARRVRVSACIACGS